MFFCDLLHVETPMLADQQKLTFYVDTVCRLEDIPRVIRERGRGVKSVFMTRLDDDDD